MSPVSSRTSRRSELAGADGLAGLVAGGPQVVVGAQLRQESRHHRVQHPLHHLRATVQASDEGNVATAQLFTQNLTLRSASVDGPAIVTRPATDHRLLFF